MPRARRLLLAALLFALLPGCRAVAAICVAGIEAALSDDSDDCDRRHRDDHHRRHR